MKSSRSFPVFPLAFSGLLLGGLGFGNLLTSYQPTIGTIIRLIFFLLWLCFTASILIHWKSTLHQLQKAPALAGFATYPMSSMQVALLFKNGSLALFSSLIWWVALLLHVGLIFSFTYLYVLKKRWDLLGPTWTVLYVGITMATVTAEVVGRSTLGKAIWTFGLVVGILLFLALFKPILALLSQKTLAPAWAILAAPLSLLLFGSIRLDIIGANPFLLLASQLLYFWVLFLIPKIFQNPFHPTFSALTFPLVISATALRASQVSFLTALSYLESLIAGIVIAFVCYSYVKWFFQTKESFISSKNR